MKTMNKRMLPLAALAAAIITLNGCSTLAPDYQRPDTQTPEQWPGGESYPAAEASDKTAADIPWREFIKDKRLQQVIELALQNNRDLRATLADVAAARATYLGQRAEQFPGLDLSLDGSRAKSSSGTTSTSYEATLGLSAYEIDLFGKNRSLTEEQLQTYLASAESGRAAQITLIAETASAWLTLASDQNQLALAQETATNAQKAMEITRKRVELGVDSRISLSGSQTTYYTAKADAASYTTQVAQDKNALWLLVGHTIDDSLLPQTLPAGDDLVTDIPAGISSAVLLKRPDVLSAEHTLKAANASIGAARAQFFPSLSLTAAGGLASAALADIFTGGASTIWSVAPSLSLPIFDGGANKADLAYSKAEKEKTIAEYQYTVQTAFQEVADALARRGTIQDQLDAQNHLVDSAQQTYDLYLKQYQAGVASFSDALEYQRTLYSAQQSLISAQLEDLDNRITLYRVLGGGLAGMDKNSADGREQEKPAGAETAVAENTVAETTVTEKSAEKNTAVSDAEKTPEKSAEKTSEPKAFHQL